MLMKQNMGNSHDEGLKITKFSLVSILSKGLFMKLSLFRNLNKTKYVSESPIDFIRYEYLPRLPYESRV